ncbi:MAG: GDSL-type esterase/lipase family protein [Cellulomonas sp.]|jgi:Flp pilus assembly pilin Flp|nr:GDSL-type esterase/lipase family protein [Cellulomonas sp.]
MRKIRGSEDEHGAAATEYVGIILAVALVGGAVILAVPSLGESLVCALSRAVATVGGGSAPSCAAPEASPGGRGGSDSPEASSGGRGGSDGQVPLSLSPVSPDGAVPGGTSTQTLQVEAPDCERWSASSDQRWAVPHNPRSQHPEVDGPVITTPYDFGAAGSGSGSMNVTLHANPGEAREATITVYCSDGRTISQRVVQPGGQQKYGGALGDSYSAAPGAKALPIDAGLIPFGLGFSLGFSLGFNVMSDLHGTLADANGNPADGDCDRGALGWPRLLGNGRATSYGTPNLQMSTGAFAACTGATTDGRNLVDDEEGFSYKSVNHQIEQSQDLADADVVTLSIGGNDIGFAKVVYDCLGGNLKSKSLEACGKSIADSKALIDNELQPKLEDTYNRLLDASPNSTIYIVGYPPAVEYDDVNDPAGLDKVQKGYRTQAAGLVEDLNAKISDTVGKVNAERADRGEGARLVFIDPTAADSPFIGHSVTDPDPYTHSMTLPPEPYSYHPNIKGNEAYADYVGKYMLGYR